MIEVFMGAPTNEGNEFDGERRSRVIEEARFNSFKLAAIELVLRRKRLP